jgi:hypothetical protein
MKFSWVIIAIGGLAACLVAAAADPALARAKQKAARACVEQPREFSLYGLFLNPRPRPNGCAPPVYAYGNYVGQDPDPFIRQQLLRDPITGFSADVSN